MDDNVFSKINYILGANLAGDQANLFRGTTPFAAVHHVP